MIRLQPDWLLTDSGWQCGWQIEFHQGIITALGPAQPGARRLSRQVVMPGLVNSHSHAFQRVIRGRTEFRHPDRPNDDFWSWRELMYRAAMSLHPDQLEVVARLLYLEMVEAGITTVGEFHYQHHQPDGTPYADPDELALRLVEAARWAGVNLVLLRCAYHRSGFRVPANPLQVRFLDRSVDESLQAVERLRGRGLSVGVAPHSVRAVPPEWLGRLAEYARQHHLPLHMHVSEQPKEIEQCLVETGLRPVQLLHREGLLGGDFTAVHAIHLEADEIRALATSTVCSCPTTERNLGDGIVPALQLRRAGVSFTLGSDSQCQVDPFEDARQLDYHLRLVRQQRAVLDEPPGKLEDWLLTCLTQSGARSLKQPCGSLQPGLRADLVAIDLDHPGLACEAPQGLLWCAPREAVSQVWCRGVPQLEDRHHPKRAEAVESYRQVMKEFVHG
ncbi:formimidoylglutamate deiminase [bacterium]|nr:formimidoylglutamate deiminase [bacterium]